MFSSPESGTRAKMLEELHPMYHGVLTAYEAFLAQLGAQRRVQDEDMPPRTRIQLGKDIEMRLARIVSAVREVRYISSGGYVLASAPETMLATGLAYCYSFGSPDGDEPRMQTGHVFSVKEFFIWGERLWTVNPNFSREPAEPNWKHDQALTRRTARAIIEEFLPSRVAKTILGVG